MCVWSAYVLIFVCTCGYMCVGLCVWSWVWIDVCVMHTSIIHVIVVVFAVCVFLRRRIYVWGLGGYGPRCPQDDWKELFLHASPSGKSGRRLELVWLTPSQTVLFKSLWSSTKHPHSYTHMCTQASTLVFFKLDQITWLVEMNFRDYRSPKTHCPKVWVNSRARSILCAEHGPSLVSAGNSSRRFKVGGRLLGQGGPQDGVTPARSSHPLWTVIFALFF